MGQEADNIICVTKAMRTPCLLQQRNGVILCASTGEKEPERHLGTDRCSSVSSSVPFLLASSPLEGS